MTATVDNEPAVQPGAAGLATVARGGLANLVGAAVSVFANVTMIVVVARATSTGRAGEFFALTAVFLLAQTSCRLGADMGLIYFLPRWLTLGQQQLVRSGLRVAFRPAIAAAVVVGGLLAGLGPQVVRLLLGDHGNANSVALVRVLAVAIPVAVGMDLVLAATRGFGRMRPTVLVDKMGRPLLQLILISLVLLAGWQWALGLAWAAPYAAAAIVGTTMLNRIGIPAGPRVRRRAEQRAAVRSEFWRFTTPRAVASVAQILLQRLDILLVASLAGVRDAAIYTVATRFVVVGQFVNQAISAPVQPRLSALLASGNRAAARTLYRVSTTWLVLLTWPIFGMCIALAPTYLAIFGPTYRRGTTTVVLLGIAMLLSCACGPVDSVLIMAGKTRWNLGTTLLALALNIGLDVALIPRFGIVGAALGWFAAIGATNLVPLALAWLRLGLHPFGRSLLGAMAAGALCFIATPLLAGVVGGTQFAPAAAVIIGAAFFGWITWRNRALFELASLIRRPAYPVVSQ
jgi:O-antigen/teichoic acid export membrane protein